MQSSGDMLWNTLAFVCELAAGMAVNMALIRLKRLPQHAALVFRPLEKCAVTNKSAANIERCLQLRGSRYGVALLMTQGEKGVCTRTCREPPLIAAHPKDTASPSPQLVAPTPSS